MHNPRGQQQSQAGEKAAPLSLAVGSIRLAGLAFSCETFLIAFALANHLQ
jgi:hypothetical protein